MTCEYLLVLEPLYFLYILSLIVANVDIIFGVPRPKEPPFPVHTAPTYIGPVPWDLALGLPAGLLFSIPSFIFFHIFCLILFLEIFLNLYV
jgi:hypothetical protein